MSCGSRFIASLSRPSALRPLQLKAGSRRGTRARKGKRHPSFVCDVARRRRGAFDLNEVSTKRRINNFGRIDPILH